jgi:vanadium chloroperoxidase
VQSRVSFLWTGTTLIGLYWAYDGAKGIGAPPRLYNQIVRQIAEQRCNSPAQNARLFALVNAAMGDAGILAWRDKYRHDLWRPVLGVPEHDSSMGPTGRAANNINDQCDPFWLPLGAPRTNTTQKSFTPPFPAYLSGHAIFGAAAFQMVRRHYKCADPAGPDDIAFELVSDELDGVSTGMNGTVRTRHLRKFDSLWQAIFENGASRVYLGVHWIFDAFPAAEIKDKDGAFKDSKDIRYKAMIGGVKLGLTIADDIYDSGMVCNKAVEPEAVSAAANKARVNVQATRYGQDSG